MLVNPADESFENEPLPLSTPVFRIVTASWIQEELSRTNQSLSLRLWQPAEYKLYIRSLTSQSFINTGLSDCDSQQSMRRVINNKTISYQQPSLILWQSSQFKYSYQNKNYHYNTNTCLWYCDSQQNISRVIDKK